MFMESVTLAGHLLAALMVGGFFAALSVLTEVIAAVPFRFNAKKTGFVALVNIISQVLMRTVYMFLPLPYLLSIILLEALVYSGEFLVYRRSRIMADETTVKLLIFTVVANTLSLVAGLYWNGLEANWGRRLLYMKSY